MRLSQPAVMIERPKPSQIRTIQPARTAMLSSVACTAWPPGTQLEPGTCPASYSSARRTSSIVTFSRLRRLQRSATASARHERGAVLRGHAGGDLDRARAALLRRRGRPARSRRARARGRRAASPSCRSSPPRWGWAAPCGGATRRPGRSGSARRSARRWSAPGRCHQLADAEHELAARHAPRARQAAARVLLRGARVHDDHVAALRHLRGELEARDLGRLEVVQHPLAEDLARHVEALDHRAGRRAARPRGCRPGRRPRCSPSRPAWRRRAWRVRPSSS